MDFKKWLMNEKAERTSSKVPLYPPQYHTKQYTPLYHTAYVADYPVWLHMEIEPYKWGGYESVFRDTPPKPTWPVYSHNTPAHAETIPHPKKWDIPD